MVQAEVTTISTEIVARVDSLLEANRSDEFAFIINNTIFLTSLVEAVTFSPAIQEQLLVDACTRNFVINDKEIECNTFSSLHQLFSGANVIVRKSQRKSFILLSQWLCNVDLELLFFGLWGASTCDVSVTLSKIFSLHSPFDFKSEMNISLLSADAVDALLENETFTVENEDAFIRSIFMFGQPSLLRHIRLSFLNTSTITHLLENLSFWDSSESLWFYIVDFLTHSPGPPSSSLPSVFPSTIISELLELLTEFHLKHFQILWQGSQDGFSATEFHRRCDGHANTLTVIMDTKGNIFGGFTPVEWESREWQPMICYKADVSLKSFLFTLKNPHNIKARKFALKASEQDKATYCQNTEGPIFGDSDIVIHNDCNIRGNHTPCFGHSYINDTGVPSDTVLTGSSSFIVKEIEVFEITD
jgi:hypothetical protein